MEREKIIKELKSNHYSVEEKENQVIVNLTRRCHFIIALHNEQMINYKEIIRSTIRFRKDVPLKSELYNAIIDTILLLFLSVGWNYINEAFLLELNIFYELTLGWVLGTFIPILYYYIRFVRVKKVLNIS